MAERKGPRYGAGHDPVTSGQDDRSTSADERDLASVDEGTELSDNNRPADSGQSDSSPVDTVSTASNGASVLSFRQRLGRTDGEVADFGDLSDEPIDLTALQDDDALLDALGGTNPDVSTSAETARPSLESLLVAWRQDVDASPISDLIDTDAAVAAIVAGSRPQRRLRRRHLVPVATAAAVLMITFTGVGVAARDAQPGDMLWSVAQVLYTDHARAALAASSAREDLSAAEGAIEGGDRTAAEAALRSAQDEMRRVDAEHGLSELEAAHASLTARIDRNDESNSHKSSTQTSSSTTTSTSPSQPLPPPPPTETTSPTTSPGTSEPTTSPSETSGRTESSSPGWQLWPNSNGTSTRTP